jgi:hypothetical protein
VRDNWTAFSFDRNPPSFVYNLTAILYFHIKKQCIEHNPTLTKEDKFLRYFLGVFVYF